MDQGMDFQEFLQNDRQSTWEEGLGQRIIIRAVRRRPRPVSTRLPDDGNKLLHPLLNPAFEEPEQDEPLDLSVKKNQGEVEVSAPSDTRKPIKRGIEDIQALDSEQGGSSVIKYARRMEKRDPFYDEFLIESFIGYDAYRKIFGSKKKTACDKLVEDHFRRSLVKHIPMLKNVGNRQTATFGGH